MSNEHSNKNQVVADPDKGDNGVVEHSNATLEGGSAKATADELAAALEVLQQRNAELEAEIASSKSRSDLNMLAEVLKDALAPKRQEVQGSDNLNRATDYSRRDAVDGRSIIEAQQTQSMFRNEPKSAISIPKQMSNVVGSSLDITVNGVRVSIPCDGKTYYINKTHYLHAKERLAKLDIQAAKTEPQVVEVS